MNLTKIEWCDLTWNPIRARNTRANRTGTFCTRISPGCKNCYASVINRRFGTGDEYEVPNLSHHEFFIDERILEEPLRRKKPARIFVGDMFDLFHEAISDADISRVFATMSEARQHTFQLLTKRADRMREFIYRWGQTEPHVWLGTSVEDKKRAYERIPQLQMTPAAVRFLSIEPQLEDIPTGFDAPELGWLSWLYPFDGVDPAIARIDWVICGGESGPGARPFNLVWAESLLKQCRAAGVPFFMKQLGSASITDKERAHGIRVRLRDHKGGNPTEWPEHLRVREFPSIKSALEVPA